MESAWLYSSALAFALAARAALFFFLRWKS